MESKINFLDEMSNFVFASRYARYNKRAKRRETWEEAVNRVKKMHLKRYDSLSEKEKEEVDWAFNLVSEQRVVPSMRSMQFGGKAVEAQHGRIFNCAVRHIDSLRSFAEVFFLLLCGNGVGIGLSKHYLGRLPDLVEKKTRTGTIITYVIEDTIEGWADSIQVLLNCYFKNTPFSGRKIVFDYSKIRSAGSILKTGGGKAPGHEGLKKALVKIKKHLDHIIEYKGQGRLKSVDAYDILMHCADAVLSGGVRRSATSIIFEPDDEDMMNSKIDHKVEKVFSFDHVKDKTVNNQITKVYEGKVLFEGEKRDVEIEEWELKKLKKDKLIWWKRLNPQRGRSNNSVLLERENCSFSDLVKTIKRTREYGEPAFVFGVKGQLYNPCFEIGFLPVVDGVCGVQFCNLTSINGRLCDSIIKFKECCKASAIIGTLQAGYTDFPYLSKAAKTLTEEESLLGCSITGMMENPEVLLDKDNQAEMAKYIIKINKVWSEKIGIKPAARTTCIKPEGSSSAVLGTSSGIHAHHARRYVRRIQMNKLDNTYQFFNLYNDKVCEESVWSENKTDDVVMFPIEVSEKAIIKKDLEALDHLKIIKDTQKNWVIPGTSDTNTKPIYHNVSCTVIVKDEEWDEVAKYIYDNREYFSAVSFLPDCGDKIYPQAPMEEIRDGDEDDEKLWKHVMDNFNHIDYKKFKEDEDQTSLTQEFTCAGGSCEIK